MQLTDWLTDHKPLAIGLGVASLLALILVLVVVLRPTTPKLQPSSVTVIKDCAGRYFLSFVVEVEPINTFASIAITRAFFACDRPWSPAIYRG